MRLASAIAAACLVLAPITAPGQPAAVAPAAQPPVVALKTVGAYKAGTRALAASLPAVALKHFHEALATAHLSDDDHRQLSLLILEASVRAGDISGLGSVTAADLPQGPASAFWLTESKGLAGRLADAEALMDSVVRTDDPVWTPAASLARSSLLVAMREPAAAIDALGPATQAKDRRTAFRAKARQAELHILIGAPEAARAVLAALKDPPTPVEAAITRYLSARLAMATGDAAAAQGIFSKLAEKPDGLPTMIVDACHLGTASALLVQGQKDHAVEAAARFINQKPESKLIPVAMDLVFRGGGFELTSLKTDIDSWIQSSQPTVACHAALRRAEAERKKDATGAAAMLEKVLNAHSDAPLAPDLALTRADLLADLGRKDEASASLAKLEGKTLAPTAAARRSFLRARLAGDNNDHAEAARLFREAAPSSPAELATPALFNAGLHSFLMDDSNAFESIVGQLAEGQGQEAEASARLLLDRGLYLATREASMARLLLWRFLEAAPNDPDVFRANLALAEISLRESPPQLDKAENQLAKIAESAPPDLRQQRDYLRVWVAEIRGNIDAASSAAASFLARWPDSPLAEEVRFKIAETLASDGRHAAARAHFAIIAANPESPLREAALFHSGLSAALNLGTDNLDDAIATFQKVADLKGPLRFLARRHQALALRRQGKTEAAASLLKETLAAADPPQAADRRAMLSLLAEILLDTPTPDPAGPREAVRLFALVRDDPSAPATERNRAAWFLGRAAEQSGQTDVAAATWFDVADSGLAAPQGGFDDWAFRCGLSLVDLQGRQGNWGAAAALAERLGRSSHPRAQDALAQAAQIRLQHFLFDDAPQPVSPSKEAPPKDAPPKEATPKEGAK